MLIPIDRNIHIRVIRIYSEFELNIHSRISSRWMRIPSLSTRFPERLVRYNLFPRFFYFTHDKEKINFVANYSIYSQ